MWGYLICDGGHRGAIVGKEYRKRLLPLLLFNSIISKSSSKIFNFKIYSIIGWLKSDEGNYRIGNVVKICII